MHSLGMYLAILLGRRKTTENWNLPDSLKHIDLSTIQCRFVLVVKKAQSDWLPPLSDALKSKMLPMMKIADFNTAPYVMNEDMARQKGFIV